MQFRRGSLSDIRIIEILKDAANSDLTGMIRFENGPIIKVVYFQNGTIAFASSNEKADRLTEVLKRAGKLTPEQVEDAQSRLKPNISLGKTLVELGYISARDLLWGARAQVEGILHHLIFWMEGIFQVLEGSLPKEIIVLNLSVPGVIFDGICKSQDRDWVLARIESPEAIYRLVADFHEKYIPHKLRMLRADDVVSRMDGRRSIEKIAQLAGIDTFEACKITAALELLSLTERAPQAVEPEEIPAPATTIPIETEPPTAEAVASHSTHGEQLTLEGASLGEVMQMPSVEELEHPPVEEPAVETPQPKEPELATNTVEVLEEDSEPPATDEGVLEPVSLPEPEPPAESAFLSAAHHDYERESSNRALWIGVSVIVVALIGSGYYHYRMTHSQEEPETIAENQVAEQPAVQKPSPKPAPVPPPETQVAKPVEKQALPVSPKTALEPKQQPPITSGAPKTVTPAPHPASVSPASPMTAPPSPQSASTSPKPPNVPTTVPEPAGNSIALVQTGKLSEAAAKWRDTLHADKSKFAVQLAIACQPDTVTDALTRFQDKSLFYILPIQFKGQPCYRVMIGNFDTAAKAEDARAKLPAEFLQQPSPPQVVPVLHLLK